jgi:MiaB-like tRNA modifying enzyme
MESLDGVMVKDESEADLVIVNTCGVKEPTEDKIIHRLRVLARASTPVVVAGCLPRISYHRIVEAIPGFAAMIGPQSIQSLTEVVPRVLESERGIEVLHTTDTSKLDWFRGPSDSVTCTVPLCEGCLGNCAYCAVRFARGEVTSHPIEDIVELVRSCVRLGYKEIRLTSQDAGVYGHDTGETLPSLLSEVATISGDHKFRLGMFNPNLMIDSIDDLLDAMESDRYFRFFHIPLQSGSNTILGEMGRLYTTYEWESVVTRIRKRFSSATIATDIIVGFPGESERDFNDTIGLIQRVKPSVVNISKYGDRPGTLASKSKLKVDTLLKKSRSRELTRVVNRIALESNESRIGEIETVLVTEPGLKGGWLCRDESYRPMIVLDDSVPGTYLEAEVIGAKRTHLIGQLISEA